MTLLLLFFSCSKAKDPSPPLVETLPQVTITGGKETRTGVDGLLRFYFVLDKKPSGTAVLQYTTHDGSAKSPTDYQAVTGTLTIPSTATEAYLDIAVRGNASLLREPNKTFTLELRNPQGCTLAQTTSQATIITEDGSFLPTDNTGYQSPDSYTGYEKLWSDEFPGEAPDPANWNFETGNGTSGWGNQELEYYTSSPKNVFLSNGNLIIEAREEAVSGFKYTSARLTTQQKKTFTFGRIDIRAKLPVGKGIWPALWMLGSNISSAGWPACGEIDIMELVGSQPSTVVGTIHWAGTGGAHASRSGSYKLDTEDFSQKFHVFSMIWKRDSLTWLVDNQPYLSANPSNLSNYPAAFNNSQFFIFNVAVGGLWPGTPPTTTVFPQRMFVDYIRVFREII